jgi:type II secretory pathway pseudopilin PulG
MVEVMVAMLLMGIAGSVLVLGTASSAQTTEDALNQCIAMGMAQQLLDEVVGTRYSPYSATGADTAHATVLQPSASQICNGTRQLFNDSGAFNGFQNDPPVDAWGIPLGTDNGMGEQRPQNFWAPTQRFANWRQQISVSYVSPTDWTVAASSPTDYRAVEVSILYVDPILGPQPLAKLRRVIAYVPPLM